MMRLWRPLEALAWAVFFTLAATVLALRYGLLPQIERYRPQIVAAVGATVGQPVKIGAIEAEWLGLRPQINLTDVRIYDAEGREVLVLPSVENILSWRSLVHGKLRLHALRIEGPRLAVRRDADGALYVAGIKLSTAGSEGRFSDWLLGQKELEVRDAEIEWRDDKRAAPPLVLSVLKLQLKNDGERHSLGVSARPPAAIGSSLELRADLSGQTTGELQAWSGRVYAELGYTDLAAWRAWLDYPADVQRGQGAVRVWASVVQGGVEEIHADLAFSGLAAKLAADLQPLELAAMSGRLEVHALNKAPVLDVRRLALTPLAGGALPPVDFRMSLDAAAEKGLVSAKALDVAPVARFAEALPLPAEMRRFALEMQPRGKLADVRYEWRGPLAAPTAYTAHAAFSELGLTAHEAVPGFARLSGTVEASETGGRVELDAHGAELELPRVFAQARLTFDALNGQLAWRRDGDAWLVDVPSLNFSNADLSGNVFGSYAYAGDGPGILDLSAVFNRADARHLARYLPLGSVMGEKSREWLVKAIVAGQATDVRFRLQGDLREFPFPDASKGEFRVSANLHHGELAYAEGWPRIQDIEGALAFDRDRMEVVGHSARVFDARLTDVQVDVGRIGGRGSHVVVSGKAQGATSQFLKFIDASPLRKTAGRFIDGMSAAGDGRLRLKLDLPLADLSTTKVSGQYELAGNEIVLQRSIPPLQQAAGSIAFTEATFALRELRGTIFGGPVLINGGTRPGGGMEFTARGDAQPAALAALFDHPLRRHLTGTTAYVASVSLREGLQRVVVESSLKGLASALPPPLEKAAADSLPIRVEYVPLDGGERDRISIVLARTLAAELHRRRDGDAMKLQRAALWLTPLAGQSIRVPERGLLIYGALGALDVDRWRTLQAADAAADGERLPTSFELKVGRLDLYGKRLHNMALRANTDSDGWSAVVDADEIAGQLSYRAKGSGQLVARLLNFSVPATVNEASAGFSAKPADLPAVDFIAERFNLRGKELGRVEFAAQRDGSDWRIEKLAVTNPVATLRGSGRWRDSVVPSTELEFTVDATDAGKLLDRLGYRGMVLGGKAQLGGSLRWRGEPVALDYASLSGELKMSVEDGEFLEIEPGLGKLISLMNLQALPRRISLDFRDVFSKGFRFDRIDAASALERGVMELREFRMRGPAAEVAMSGEADLAHETQRLKVRVVPSLGGSASTVVGIVNPVIGVAAALAQHVLQNPLGQIFAHEFEVTGTWSDPKVAKLAAVPMQNETVNP